MRPDHQTEPRKMRLPKKYKPEHKGERRERRRARQLKRRGR